LRSTRPFSSLLPVQAQAPNSETLRHVSPPAILRSAALAFNRDHFVPVD
jgi:hypothetical protein